MATKKRSVQKTQKSQPKKLHHKVANHLEKPVSTIFGYTIILMFLVAVLVIVATYF